MVDQQTFKFMQADIDTKGYMFMPPASETITVGSTTNNFPSIWQYNIPYDYEKEQLKVELLTAKKHIDQLVEIVHYLTKGK